MGSTYYADEFCSMINLLCEPDGVLDFFRDDVLS